MLTSHLSAPLAGTAVRRYVSWYHPVTLVIYCKSRLSYSILCISDDTHEVSRYRLTLCERAGWFARRMGLPADKLIIATNENDILDRFFKSGGSYSKKPVRGKDAKGGIAEDGAKAHSDGVKETLSPAMDILVSSNFERLLWFLASEVDKSSSIEAKRKAAGETIKAWLNDLKANGSFSVGGEVVEAASTEFDSERVSDEETIATIRHIYTTCSPTTSAGNGGYVLDPHSAVGVAAALRSIEQNPATVHISLSTAHPAKFSNAVDLALRKEPNFDFSKVLPKEFVGLEEKERRVRSVPGGVGWEGVRAIVKEEVEMEVRGER